MGFWYNKIAQRRHEEIEKDGKQGKREEKEGDKEMNELKEKGRQLVTRGSELS